MIEILILYIYSPILNFLNYFTFKQIGFEHSKFSNIRTLISKILFAIYIYNIFYKFSNENFSAETKWFLDLAAVVLLTTFCKILTENSCKTHSQYYNKRLWESFISSICYCRLGFNVYNILSKDINENLKKC